MHACCQQVKDFLDYGRELHGEIRGFYDGLNEHTDKERVKMLLGYLSRHEQRIEDSLERFEQVTRQEILAVWLQHVPRLDIHAICERCGVAEGMSVDDVAELALKFGTALLGLYREVADQTGDPRVKAVFGNIVAMEEKEQNQLLCNVSALREM